MLLLSCCYFNCVIAAVCLFLAVAVGWSDIFIRRFWSFLGAQNFEFQYFGDFQKNEYCLGYQYFVHIFGVHHKIGLNLWGHFYAF